MPAAAGAHCLVLITEWNQFRSLDLKRLKAAMAAPNFVDLRNVYRRRELETAGFAYHSIGRSGDGDDQIQEIAAE